MSDEQRLEMVDALMAWMDTRLRRSEFEQHRGDQLLGAGDARPSEDGPEERRLAQAEQYAEKVYRLALARYVDSRVTTPVAFAAATRAPAEPWPNMPAVAAQTLLS